jgi:hypothetical protein
MTRRPSRLEALAVLRGELEYWRERGAMREAAAVKRAIAVLSGEIAPSAPAPPMGERREP